jgi:hypothetical protein
MSDIIGYFCIPAFKNVSLLHQKYVQETRSLEEIASESKCSTQTVKKHLKLAGIPFRPHPHPRIPKGTKDKNIISLNEIRVNQMMLEYRRLGMSAQKIADIMNHIGIPPRFKAKSWHYRTVHKIVQKHGLGRVKLNR